MEFFQYAAEILLDALGESKLQPLLNILKKNDFDVKKTVAELKSETVLPLLKEFLAAQAAPINRNFNEESYGTQPITDVADEKIVTLLNRYLE